MNHLQVTRFPETQRFVNDGTTRPDRLPNFLNRADPQVLGGVGVGRTAGRAWQAAAVRVLGVGVGRGAGRARHAALRPGPQRSSREHTHLCRAMSGGMALRKASTRAHIHR